MMTIDEIVKNIIIDVSDKGVIMSSPNVFMADYESLTDVIPFVLDQRFNEVKFDINHIRIWYNHIWYYKRKNEDFYEFLERVSGG